MCYRILSHLLRPTAAACMLMLASFACVGATINVNTTADAINAGDGLCSLREAIIAANTNAASGGVAGECIAGSGTDTINIPAGTYTLTIAPAGANDATTGDLNITEAVSLVGTGNPTVQGGGGWADGIFSIEAPAGTVAMSGFTISGGNRNIASGVTGGGGVRAIGAAAVTLTSMVIQNNAVTHTGSALS